jgi:hypothetical protein
MDISILGPSVFRQALQKSVEIRERNTAPPIHQVNMTYEASINRTVVQVVSEGEVEQQIPSADTISFIRSFKAVVAAVFERYI